MEHYVPVWKCGDGPRKVLVKRSLGADMTAIRTWIGARNMMKYGFRAQISRRGFGHGIGCAVDLVPEIWYHIVKTD